MIWIAVIAVVAIVCVGLLLLFCRSRSSENDAMKGGGVKNNTNYDAPKTISSAKITSFLCEFSALYYNKEDNRIAGYVYELKAELKDGEVIGSYYSHDRYDSERYSFVADADFMDEIQKIVTKHDLAQHNGLSYHVSGLPEGCGAYLSVDYESKESITASNNQTCFLSIAAMEELEQLFRMQAQEIASNSSDGT